ncbi:alpha/beta fold hydrolase [Fictibacillus fluitans]|uniref:Alpha/beta hydrolase n=1 Tax=Fictibacillus fluitans TaxID=3058422 RepID=A0ABT8HVH8_9BACL|nr:alpha/beta hydrolase [Fictibacillus sp. NE201]MDN4524749.1 alpha/beta hydrolase [Fictibacillus sp. NE201]
MEQQVRTFYEESGSGQPVVFIHPPALTSRIFSYQHKYLSSCSRVITYDLRGHGNTPCPSDKVSIPMMADDMLALLDKLGVQKAVICGYSAGGSIAQEFALRYPERVKGLVLPGGFPQVASWLLQREFRLGIYLAKHHPNVLVNGLAWTHQVTSQDGREIKAESKKGSPSLWHRLYEESLNYSCTKRLPQLEVPLLLFYGSRSFYFLPFRKVYQKLVSHVKTVIVPGAFHQIPVKQYQYFNGELARWLTEIK